MKRGPARFRVFFVLAALVAILLSLQLADLQILQKQTWAKERAGNILGREFLSAPRGRILAKDGIVLVEDRMRFELAIQYRYFRRQHPLALLLHFDQLTRWIQQEEGDSILARRFRGGLVTTAQAGQGLQYQDGVERFEEALDRWLSLPCSKLRRQGIGLQLALSSLRFYTFRLLSLTVEGDQTARFGKDYQISSRFNGWGQEQDGLSILARFAPALTGLEGRRAEIELRSRLGQVLIAGHDHLRYLDGLLAKEKIPPRNTVFQRLDSLRIRHSHVLHRWLAKLQQKRIERAKDKDSEGFVPMIVRFVFGEERLEAPDLEARIEKRYDIEGYQRLLFPGVPVSFDTIVALIIGRQERYPGFRIQERYGRFYPRGTEERRYPKSQIYDAKMLQGLPPVTLGWVKTWWKDPPKEPQANEAAGEKEVVRTQDGQTTDAQPKRPRMDHGLSPLEDDAFETLSEQLRSYWFDKGRLSKREGGSGLEKSLDPILRGKGGLRSTFTDRLGREVGMPNMAEAKPGRDVKVTLDWDLQGFAEQHLERMAKEMGFGLHDTGKSHTSHYSSAALAMIDARTGDVLCMASYPRALLVRRKDAPDELRPTWKNFTLDRPSRLGLIGSTIKPFMAVEALIRFPEPLALIEECQGFNYQQGSGGRFSYQGRSFSVSCHSHLALHVPEGVENAIQESCNACFCQLGRLMGRGGIEAGLRRFGLFYAKNEKMVLPLGLNLRKPGFDRAEWPLNRRGIGYGVEAVPLLVARAYAGLGTGRLPDLRIVDSIDGIRQDRSGQDLGIQERILSRVRRGLERVVTRGTARGYPWLRRATVAGKTGTAILWVPGLERGKDAKRYRAWFSGYYPSKQPAIAFSCAFFGAKQGGGKAAAKSMDAFFASLDAHPELHRYLPSFARSRRGR